MANSEIEIKAYIKDFDSVLNFLRNNAKFKKKYFKKDIYYAKENDIKEKNIKTSDCIRLRIEHGGYTFCTKERNLIEGVEVNEEIEIKVSRKKARFIINFLSKLQKYKEYVKKEKKGYAFIYKNALVEISKIKNLDNFIEIEFLNSNETIENQIIQLKSILNEIGIDKNCIETEPYIKLLAEKK
ncbi:class IV adenylate cyclase [Brachyspira hampsonii]|uniref:class IV adenylate cyclase n=1 Tax=Brachyspira hampsonii TaxID=1287055 RepID=UPI000D3348BB|nr:class IV adenylate cyclase [Brachyspira hampsonii]PTY41200.1 adenylate cyclase [Brachyspira hampsonii bv. II]